MIKPEPAKDRVFRADWTHTYHRGGKADFWQTVQKRRGSVQKNITVTGILDVKSAILFGQSVVSLMGVFRCKIVSVVKCKESQLQRFRSRSE